MAAAVPRKGDNISPVSGYISHSDPQNKVLLRPALQSFDADGREGLLQEIQYPLTDCRTVTNSTARFCEWPSQFCGVPRYGSQTQN